MSEISRDGIDKVGPDYFTYYTCAVKEVLSHDDNFLPLTAELSGGRCGEFRDKGAVGQSYNCSGSVFKNSVGAALSNYKNERLNVLLRQAVAALTPEVDEMLDPVVAMRRLQLQVRSKKLATCESDASQGPTKKLRMSSSSSSIPSPGDDDLQFLLERDDSLVDEMIKKYSDELFAKLGHMERQLELLLDVVVSTCRSMSRFEKQQLLKLIQKLPPQNLNRVVDIVQHSKCILTQNGDEIFVDLEQELRKQENLHVSIISNIKYPDSTLASSHLSGKRRSFIRYLLAHSTLGIEGKKCVVFEVLDRRL